MYKTEAIVLKNQAKEIREFLSFVLSISHFFCVKKKNLSGFFCTKKDFLNAFFSIVLCIFVSV